MNIYFSSPQHFHKYFFAVVGAMQNQYSNILREGKLHAFDIPKDNRIDIMKVIDGKEEPDDFLEGTLAHSPEPPVIEHVPFGYVIVVLDSGKKFYARLWNKVGYKDRKFDGKYDSAKTTYSCTILRENAVSLKATLFPSSTKHRKYGGVAHIYFVNQHQIFFEGELQLALVDEQQPAKKRSGAGPSFTASMFTD